MTSNENSSSFLREITERDVAEWYEEMMAKIDALREKVLRWQRKVYLKVSLMIEIRI